MTKDTAFYQKKILKLGRKAIVLDRPLVMGILNATPDSFFEGSRVTDTDQVLKSAEEMLRSGADILDVGGYSTRPGADEVDLNTELSRVEDAVTAIVREFPEAVVSVDTFRSQVARRAVEAGAVMVNDVSGGELDAEMFATVADMKVPYVLMHMRGTPSTMQSMTDYEDIVLDLLSYFQEKLRRLHRLGVNDVILDPGFGFAKTLEQNYELLRRLKELRVLGYPVLGGLSRKSMIWKTLGVEASEALNGTTAVHMLALMGGCSILRVHDVKEAKEAVRIYEAYAGTGE